MTALPAEVTYGTVTGKFVLAVADTGDADVLPDAQPAVGTVTFTPSAARIMSPTSTPPLIIIGRSIVFTLSATGELVDSTGATGVKLMATDDSVLSPSSWSWAAKVDLNGVTAYSFNFALPAGSTVDLSSVTPLATSITQTDLQAAVQARNDALAAVGAAQAAVATVAYSTWQATTAYVTNQTVQAPDGTLIKSNATRTSRASFDATEQAAWTPVATKTGTLEQVALAAAFGSSDRSAQTPGIWKAVSTGVGRAYVGHDATAGVTFWVDPTNLYLSSDNGDTYTTGKGLPTGVTNGFSIYKVVRFKGLWAMIASDASDSGKYKVYTCTVATGNTALTWTAVKTLAVNATNISGALGVSASGNTLIATEYTATPNITGGPSIYRTTDGTTWTTVNNQATARHFHGVWEDPYNAGTWYALLGDGTTTPVLKSTNDGVTWAAVSSIGSGWDGVSMSFSPKYVWCTGDMLSLANVAPFYVFDRATGTPQVGTTDSPISTPVVSPGVFTTGAVCVTGNNYFTMGSSYQPLTVDDIGLPISLKINSNGSLIVPSGTTIVDVVGGTVYLSNPCSQSSSAFTYIVQRNERYYPFGLYGAVDPANEVFYLVADNAGGAAVGLPFRYALFACINLFGPLTWLDNLITASRLVEVVGTQVVTANHHRPTITVAKAV